MSFLSDSQREEVRSQLIALHNELSRNISVFQAEKQTFISTDESYSGAYKKSFGDKEVEYSEQEIKARIYYKDTNLDTFEVLDANISTAAVDGQCLIRVEEQGYEIMKYAEKVIVDGKEMKVISSSKPVGNGVFNGLFWDFLLEPVTSEV